VAVGVDEVITVVVVVTVALAGSGSTHPDVIRTASTRRKEKYRLIVFRRIRLTIYFRIRGKGPVASTGTGSW
jgi:hypothetical protein